jgi:general secretion pathway protein A
LLSALNYQESDGLSSCEEIGAAGLSCESGRAQLWSDLLAYNRPAVIELVTPEKFSAYAALPGLRGDRAVLVSAAGIVESPLAALGPLWSGDFLFIWKPPPGYEKPIGPGQSGPAVKWLAEQFALLDGEQTTLSEGGFNDALAERVRIFQRGKGLAVDGVAGMLTLLALNETLGRDTTLADAIVLSVGGG